MHRSGTTLLVRLLEQLGFFPGWRREENGEPWFFLRRNEWLLRRAGGGWDRPLPVLALLADPGFRAETAALFAAEVRSSRFRGYGRGGDLSGPWGWKDPRTTFLLEIWAEVFPGARVLDVRRNGVDVAQSLVARTQRARAHGHGVLRRWSLRSRMKAALQPLEFLNHFSLSSRCTTLHEAFALWEEYVAQARSALAAFRGETMSIAFEDLLASPRERLAEIARFCGCNTQPERIAAAVATIDAGRAHAFTARADLVAFHDEVRGRPLMRELGYGERP